MSSPLSNSPYFGCAKCHRVLLNCTCALSEAEADALAAQYPRLHALRERVQAGADNNARLYGKLVFLRWLHRTGKLAS